MRSIFTRPAADLLGYLVAEMAARRQTARMICAAARRPIDVRICRIERVVDAHSLRYVLNWILTLVLTHGRGVN